MESSPFVARPARLELQARGCVLAERGLSLWQAARFYSLDIDRADIGGEPGPVGDGAELRGAVTTVGREGQGVPGFDGDEEAGGGIVARFDRQGVDTGVGTGGVVDLVGVDIAPLVDLGQAVVLEASVKLGGGGISGEALMGGG